MKDPLGYGGRHVVVTGSASGMGAACAQLLVELEAEVTGIDNKPTEAVGVRSVKADFRDRVSIDEAVAAIEGPVHAVFSCAGLPGLPFSDLDTMLVNFVGCRHLMESLVPLIPAGGAISAIASNAGIGWQFDLEKFMALVTSPDFATGRAWCEANPDVVREDAYALSKQVLNAWVAWRAAALIERGIRLNNINPGPTDTPMMVTIQEHVPREEVDAFLGPVARYSRPDEQAWPMIVLNSPRLSIVNGVGLHTDGGFLGAMLVGLIDLDAVPD